MQMNKGTRPLSEGHLSEAIYLWQFIFSNQPKTGAFLHDPETLSGGPKFVRISKTAFIVIVLEDEWV